MPYADEHQGYMYVPMPRDLGQFINDLAEGAGTDYGDVLLLMIATGLQFYAMEASNRGLHRLAGTVIHDLAGRNGWGPVTRGLGAVPLK